MARKNNFRLILFLLGAIAVGILIGLFARGTVGDDGQISGTANSIMQFVGSVKHICGQFIFYAVPLVIIGFISSSITRLGKNASKILMTAVSIAYASNRRENSVLWLGQD